MRKDNYILKTITHLREKEEVLIFDDVLDANLNEEKEIIDYLKSEYDYELVSYPYQVPAFDEKAALWSAYVLYFSCQFILHRKQLPEEFEGIFPKYSVVIDASAMLSADLLLRFLPIIIEKLKDIDDEDELIPFLEKLLSPWYYSGIGYDLADSNKNIASVLNNQCMLQLSVERIIEKQDQVRAINKNIQPYIKANLGIHQESYWKEINL